MARVSPAARAAAAWRSGGKVAGATPAHVQRGEAYLAAIVNDRPPDWFRPGSLELLEQLCEVVIAQRAASRSWRRRPPIPRRSRSKSLAGIVNSTRLRCGYRFRPTWTVTAARRTRRSRGRRAARRMEAVSMTDGEKVLAFVEKYLRVLDGRLVGEPVQLAWQRGDWRSTTATLRSAGSSSPWAGRAARHR